MEKGRAQRWICQLPDLSPDLSEGARLTLVSSTGTPEDHQTLARLSSSPPRSEVAQTAELPTKPQNCHTQGMLAVACLPVTRKTGTSRMSFS